MPILQKRVLSIIQAGTDFETAYNTLVAQIEAENKGTRQGTQTARQALDNIAIVVAFPGYFLDRAQSQATLEFERRYYRTFAKRNESAARRAREKRNGQGKGTGQFTGSSPFPVTRTFGRTGKELDIDALAKKIRADFDKGSQLTEEQRKAIEREAEITIESDRFLEDLKRDKDPEGEISIEPEDEELLP